MKDEFQKTYRVKWIDGVKNRTLSEMMPSVERYMKDVFRIELTIPEKVRLKTYLKDTASANEAAVDRGEKRVLFKCGDYYEEAAWRFLMFEYGQTQKDLQDIRYGQPNAWHKIVALELQRHKAHLPYGLDKRPLYEAHQLHDLKDYAEKHMPEIKL